MAGQRDCPTKVCGIPMPLCTIKFKRTTNKEISKLSQKTALIIQALKSPGKEIINSIVVSKIQSGIDETEKKVLLIEAKYATSWIYEVIKTICK